MIEARKKLALFRMNGHAALTFKVNELMRARAPRITADPVTNVWRISNSWNHPAAPIPNYV